MKFQHPDSGLTLLLSDSATLVLMKHRQIHGKGKEAGGQLFAKFINKIACIEYAGEPKNSDRRWWNGFIPCRKTERGEISSLYKRGLHFVGDWHTHPELIPQYSNCDLESTRDCLMKSQHNLSGLLMAIVGYAEKPDDAIRIWYVTQKECALLKVIGTF